MIFQCQRSGKCCSHPNILITLTHIDIWELINYFGDLPKIFKLIQFIKLDSSNLLPDQLVLDPINTSDGKGLFILRKKEKLLNECIFYQSEDHSCQIYAARPQSCRNFPFGLSSYEGQAIVTWVKGAFDFCPGIGKGQKWIDQDLKTLGKQTQALIADYSKIVFEINKEAKLGNPVSSQDVIHLFYSLGNKK